MHADAKYLHVKELAAEWRQHPATIYRKIQSGAIPAVRLGAGHSALRIPVDELDRFVRGSSPQQPPEPGGAVSQLPPSRPEGAA